MCTLFEMFNSPDILNMGRFNWRMLFSVVLIASHFQDAAQVIIKDQVVPSFVPVGKHEYIILDCDYDLEESSTDELVVKWWHNENDQVYQWIYGDGPQAMGIVDKYIDLTYKASTNPATMYRAMRLNHPGIDLTGDYTCTVSTMANEDTQTKSMVVFSTGKLNLNARKTSVDGVAGVEVTCDAEGLYPEPTLDISVDNVPVGEDPALQTGDDNRWNISMQVEFRDQDIQNPSILICSLSIPEANYTDSVERIYYPGPPTTTTTSSTTLQRKMDIQALDNSQPDTDNGGGNIASSISNGLIIMLVSITAGSASIF